MSNEDSFLIGFFTGMFVASLVFLMTALFTTKTVRLPATLEVTTIEKSEDKCTVISRPNDDYVYKYSSNCNGYSIGDTLRIK